MRAYIRRPAKDSTLLKIAIVLVSVLLWLTAAVTDNEVFTLGIHVARIGAAIGMLWVFKGHWIPVFSAERIGKVDIMALAVLAWGLSTMYHAGYSLTWRILDRPDNMMSSDWNTVGYLLGLVGMLCMQGAQRNDRNEVPRANLIWNLMILLIGVAVGAMGALYHTQIFQWLPQNVSIGF